MKTIITIGRSSDNDIVFDEKYETVSSHHATITRDGDNYVFEDHSTNGTRINNQMVHNSSFSIHRGDAIKLADSFKLGWQMIDDAINEIDRATQLNPQKQNTPAEESKSPNPKCLKKFNWGAFMLPFIWKSANGTDGLFWGLGGCLLLYLGRAIPKMYSKTGEVDWMIIFLVWLIGTRIGGILYGFWGNEGIWENSTKNIGPEEFDRVQEKWNNVGKVLAVVLIPLWIIGVMMYIV